MTDVIYPKVIIYTATQPAGYTHAQAVAALDAEGIPESIKQMVRAKLPPGASVTEWRWSIRSTIGAAHDTTERTEAGP